MKKMNSQQKAKLAARVVALILAGMMIVGAAYYAIYLIAISR